MTGQEAREDEREALARLVNDSHNTTRSWEEMRQKTVFERTNGDDYAIAQGYAAADAILAAGYRKHPEPEWEYGVTTKWGMHEHPHFDGAERYAKAVREEIEDGRIR